jgi:hypothetical protein
MGACDHRDTALAGQSLVRQRHRATRHRSPDRGDDLGIAHLLAQSHPRTLSRR